MHTIPVFAALFLLVACDGSDSMNTESGGGEIAFTVNRTDWNEIWLMGADGSDRRRLTEVEPAQNDAAGSSSPAWSPDGRASRIRGSCSASSARPPSFERHLSRVRQRSGMMLL